MTTINESWGWGFLPRAIYKPLKKAETPSEEYQILLDTQGCIRDIELYEDKKIAKQQLNEWIRALSLAALKTGEERYSKTADGLCLVYNDFNPDRSVLNQVNKIFLANFNGEWVEDFRK